MEEIQLILAKNLKAIREKKKLSLEKTADLTGVSKTMIGQIERGESSPTLNTIWKIANGLKISFTSLIQHQQPEAKVVKRDEVQVLSEDDGKYNIYPYFPFEEDKRFEIYSVEIKKGGYISAEAHQEGTVEYITVFDGELTVRVNDNDYLISAGDSIQFNADKPHTYHNSGDKLTKLSMTIYYPG
ncbi:MULTISPECIES: helix-turn-helix domain-containing protein [Bacillaceae]|uniref:helix-turn-helix domain-containing protein n=1 Tax=Bacillaceae TaxID=186817 RepID=UPI001E505A2A|nr:MULTISPECIES: XRE family transcriptional regulator [Bacillaceae]MCE4050332.1 XRE family transcriptional regulator [Bacillus sp. Au-Bac7]MCM3029567.1 XRE family transcriptional regulator [Niallia sp. MER 6]